MSAIQVSHVSLRLKKKNILNDVTFEARTGSVLGVVGHNGAGKTCLFHIILGLKFASEGSVTIGGVEVPQPRSRTQIGYVPERPYIQLDRKFKSWLGFHAQLTGVKRNISEEVHRVARGVGLDAHLNQKLSTFSKGMLQKALLAQASLGDPEIFILDEPMSGLDPEARDALRGYIRDWKRSGKTIVFSSHALEDIEALADDVLSMKEGVVQFFGSVSDWRKVR